MCPEIKEKCIKQDSIEEYQEILEIVFIIDERFKRIEKYLESKEIFPKPVMENVLQNYPSINTLTVELNSILKSTKEKEKKLLSSELTHFLNNLI